MKDITIVGALTLRAPWGQAVIYGTKRIENRKWSSQRHKPPFWMAIHVGLNEEDYHDVSYHLAREELYDVLNERHHPGRIIGLAHVVKYITKSDDPWFDGPIGWVIDEVIPLDPIPARGKQQLWPLTPNVERIIHQQLDAKKRFDEHVNGNSYPMILAAFVLGIGLEEATYEDRIRCHTLVIKTGIYGLERLAQQKGFDFNPYQERAT
jgi:hypothetical protein